MCVIGSYNGSVTILRNALTSMAEALASHNGTVDAVSGMLLTLPTQNIRGHTCTYSDDMISTRNRMQREGTLLHATKPSA